MARTLILRVCGGRYEKRCAGGFTVRTVDGCHRLRQSYSHANTRAYGRGYAHNYAQSYARACGHGYANTYSYANVHGHSYPCAYANTYGYANARAYGYAGAIPVR